LLRARPRVAYGWRPPAGRACTPRWGPRASPPQPRTSCARAAAVCAPATGRTRRRSAAKRPPGARRSHGRSSPGSRRRSRWPHARSPAAHSTLRASRRCPPRKVDRTSEPRAGGGGRASGDHCLEWIGGGERLRQNGLGSGATLFLCYHFR
jgi:hypothetical protein